MTIGFQRFSVKKNWAACCRCVSTIVHNMLISFIQSRGPVSEKVKPLGCIQTTWITAMGTWTYDETSSIASGNSSWGHPKRDNDGESKFKSEGGGGAVGVTDRSRCCV